MTLNEFKALKMPEKAMAYQELCMCFASEKSKSSNESLLLQGALGLCGESSEVLRLKGTFDEDNPILDKACYHLERELGDVLWYAATTCKAIGYDFVSIVNDAVLCSDHPMFTVNYSMTLISIDSGIISDVVKKITFHGHELNSDNICCIGMKTSEIVTLIGYISTEILNKSILEIMDTNIEKLSARYPEGHFNTERSLHRKAGDI